MEVKKVKNAQTGFAYQSSATQVLFLQHAINSLKSNGRCGIVLDEGILYRINETAFVATRRNLLNECNVWCIISLPAKTFAGAGGGVKTNILFFKKGEPTEKIWYYDLSSIKVKIRTPLTEAHFEEFLRLLPSKGASERSWTVDITERKLQAEEKAAPFKLKATDISKEAVKLREKLTGLKKAKQHETNEYKDIEQAAKELEKEAREFKAQAQAIEDAVYDLKAVNPNAKNEEDARTPEELLDFIEIKGREVTDILASLRAKE